MLGFLRRFLGAGNFVNAKKPCPSEDDCPPFGCAIKENPEGKYRRPKQPREIVPVEILGDRSHHYLDY